ncbi:Kelch repeat-containing protein [Candidatus Magnetomorum sp. HK-1]|nr:Kelch repeat-containing protein [Candidatus Magnetomorum sp. HK-1]
MKQLQTLIMVNIIILHSLVLMNPTNALPQIRSTGNSKIYIASPTSTNNGGGLFGSILHLEVTINGNNAEFNVSKQDGTKFTSSGLMFFTCLSSGKKVYKDITQQVSFDINLDSCLDDSSMDFYASYEVDSTQVAWVGPIKVTANRDNCPDFVWNEPENNSIFSVPFFIRGNAFDLDKIKKVTIALIDSSGNHYNVGAYNTTSPNASKIYIETKIDPSYYGLQNGLITIGIWIVDAFNNMGCDNVNQPVSKIDVLWKVGKLEVTPQEDFISTGEKGGSFSPSYKYYTLKNTGGTALNFSISKNKSWIELSRSSGKLEPDKSASVKVSFSNDANELEADTYDEIIQFINTTNHQGDMNRKVTLTVNKNPGVLEVTPQEKFVSSGEKGGSFSPKSTSYTLKNTGGTAIHFSISKNNNWLELSPTSGRIEPDATITVNVSISNNANQLEADTYDDIIQFTNTTNHQGDTNRNVTLTVTPKPGILEVSPQENFVSSGEKGGTFFPLSKKYTIKNSGGTAITFSISKKKSWTDLSISEGKLNPDESKVVEVFIDSSAGSLSSGKFVDEITFLDLNNKNESINIPVTLTISDSIEEGRLLVTPDEDCEFTIEQDEPLTTFIKTFTIKNIGGQSFTYSIDKTENWLDFSTESGQINPNESIDCNVTLNSNAMKLSTGKYTGKITINNETNNSSQTINVRLIITDADSYTVWLEPDTYEIDMNSSFHLELHAKTMNQKLGSYQFVLTFDSNMIEIDDLKVDQGVEEGKDGFLGVINDLEEGKLVINGFDTDGKGPGDDLTILKLYFKTSGISGRTKIELSVSSFTNESAESIGFPNGKGTIINIVDVITGDVNGDKNISIADALLVARYSAMLDVSGFTESAADVNSDGNISIADALLIARKAAGLESFRKRSSLRKNKVANIMLQPDIIDVEENAKFVININTSIANSKIGSYQFDLTFDSLLLAVDTTKGTDGVEQGEDGFLGVVNVDNTKGTITINGFNTQGVGPGDNLNMVKINFNVLNDSAESATYIRLTVNDLTDELADNIHFSDVTGTAVNIMTNEDSENEVISEENDDSGCFISILL